MISLPRLVIAAPASGSGKSVIAVGLMAAFAQRMRVQSFKVGPDYIDPMYHAAATGRPARNLDIWMAGHDAVVRSVAEACEDADLTLIEGVMGLFDGAGGGPLDGTTAEVARLVGAPIVLVVDASRMAGSVAAVVHGFDTLAPGVKVAGIIANRIGSARHADLVREALAPLGIPLLGLVPRTPELGVPERHLGLVTAAEHPEAAAEAVDRARSVVAAHLDLDGLLALAAAAPAIPAPAAAPEPRVPCGDPVPIAVARDEAFCFYYEDNLQALRRAGARIVPFSPLHDECLPDGVAGIYLGGGYPELHAARLAANTRMLASLRAAGSAGMPIYAECGGLILLTEGIDGEAVHHDLMGLLPGRCTMATRATLGYRDVELLAAGPLGMAGRRLRGHEFHYSTWHPPTGTAAAYRVHPRGGAAEGPVLEGYAAGNLFASYVHLHFAQDSSLAASIVAAGRAWRDAVAVATGTLTASLP